MERRSGEKCLFIILVKKYLREFVIHLLLGTNVGVSVSYYDINLQSLPKGNSCGDPCECTSVVVSLEARSVLRLERWGHQPLEVTNSTSCLHWCTYDGSFG